MSLQIKSTPTLLGINITHGKMDISYPSNNFKLNVNYPKTKLSAKLGRIKIDQTKPLAEIGFKKISQFTRDEVEKHKQTAMSGISRIVREGNELSDIIDGGRIIALQAERNAFDSQLKETNVKFIPKSRPEIELVPGVFDIELIKGNVNIRFMREKPRINYKLGTVDIYVKQKPNIDIKYKGNKIDSRV